MLVSVCVVHDVCALFSVLRLICSLCVCIVFRGFFSLAPSLSLSFSFDEYEVRNIFHITSSLRSRVLPPRSVSRRCVFFSLFSLILLTLHMFMSTILLSDWVSESGRKFTCLTPFPRPIRVNVCMGEENGARILDSFNILYWYLLFHFSLKCLNWHYVLIALNSSAKTDNKKAHKQRNWNKTEASHPKRMVIQKGPFKRREREKDNKIWIIMSSTSSLCGIESI